MLGLCAICKRTTATAPLCEQHHDFGYLGGLVLAGRLTDFIDDNGIPSAFPHPEWMKAHELRVMEQRDSWQMEIHVVLAVHGWRLDQPWGSLPGDGKGEGAAA